MGSPFRDLDPASRAVMQGMVDEYYQRFVGVVTANRHLPTGDTAKMITDGRVFSGERAVELGLADRTGLLNDAIDEAKKMAHAENAKTIMYKRPYGYSGSIYAQSETAEPRANVYELKIPGLNDRLPTGFYYLWAPE